MHMTQMSENYISFKIILSLLTGIYIDSQNVNGPENCYEIVYKSEKMC
jgi:hypothetical protein